MVSKGGRNVRIRAIEQSDFKTQYRSKRNEMRIEGYNCQGEGGNGMGWENGFEMGSVPLGVSESPKPVCNRT